MIKIMVVEDDILSRIGLVSMLKAESDKFEVVAQADNGKAALDRIEITQPDIILTDVEMPVMNGIELIKEIKNRGLNIRFIVLSAYSQFNYVREAMILGADDYLLKLELDQEKLVKLLLTVASKINKVENDGNELSKDIRKEHLQSKYMYYLLTGKFNSNEEIRQKFQQIDIKIPEKNLVCMFVHRRYVLDDMLGSAVSINKIFSVINGWIANYGTGYGYIVDTNLFTMVLSLNDEYMVNHGNLYASNLSNSMYQYIQKCFGLNLFIQVSDMAQKYTELPAKFRKLYKSLETLNGLSDYTEIGQENGISVSFGAELSTIDTVLSCNNISDIPAAFDTLISAIGKYDEVPTKILHGICFSLIYFIDRFISSNGYNVLEWSRTNEMLKLIKQFRTHEQYIEYIKYLSDFVHKTSAAEFEYLTVISKAKKYIKKCYSEDISLETVAAYVNLNPTYFSRIFSRQTGQTFIDYLTDVRIEVAKNLLKNTDMRVQEISEEIGYNNAYYFSRLFKKHTNITPLDFRSSSREPK